jgi:hypothetical protein
MKSGTARVFDHQIPGGQYSNLLVQCTSMGIQGEQWNAVLDAYRDVNMLFGDIVKVSFPIIILYVFIFCLLFPLTTLIVLMLGHSVVKSGGRSCFVFSSQGIENF